MNGYVFSPENQNMWVIAVILVFLASAVALELFRKRRGRKKLAVAEWRAVRQLIKERDFTPEEARLLESIAAQHAPRKPFRTVTVRQEFEACIATHLEELERRGDDKLFEERGAMLHDIRVRLGLDYIPFGRRINTTRELYYEQNMWMTAEPAAAADSWYRMSVTAVDEAHFHVRPEGGGAPPGLSKGKEHHFRMWREEDGRYRFSARLVRIESGPTAYMFRHAHNLERTQAREHFRVRYDQTGNISILNAPVDGDMSGLDKRQTIMRVRGRFTSLSGGGFAVIVSQPVPKQVLLRVPLELKEGTAPLEVYARLVAVQPMPGGEYLLRAAFAGLDDEDRDRITHYAFERQKTLPPEEGGPAGSGS